MSILSLSFLSPSSLFFGLKWLLCDEVIKNNHITNNWFKSCQCISSTGLPWQPQSIWRDEHWEPHSMK